METLKQVKQELDSQGATIRASSSSEDEDCSCDGGSSDDSRVEGDSEF